MIIKEKTFCSLDELNDYVITFVKKENVINIGKEPTVRYNRVQNGTSETLFQENGFIYTLFYWGNR